MFCFRLPKRSAFILITIFSVILTSCGQTNNSSSKNLSTSSQVKIKVGNSPGSVEIADFNNDQLPDLAVTSETDGNVTVLLGNGKGSFSEAPGSPFATGNIPNDIAKGDFNKDGNIDLAFANHDRNYLTVLLGKGDGSFAPAPNSPFRVGAIPHVHGIATGDFNADGRLDLATDSWGNDQVEVLFGDSIDGFKTPGTFFKVGKHPYQRLRAADVNHDAKDDIVTTNLDGDNVTVLLNGGESNFSEPQGSPFPCGDSPFGVAIGDVNADGNPDLAVVNSPASTADGTGTNGLTILLGDGGGKFMMMKGSPFNAGNIPNRVAIGDVSGDGVNDILVSDNSSDKIYLYLMDKNKTVATQSTISVGNHPKGIAIADLNADGRGDIVVCNFLDNNISIIISK